MSPKSMPDLENVHARLKTILAKYRGHGLEARPDTPTDFTLIGPPTPQTRGRELWFGAVQVRKNYVSYHLMPVYGDPSLLNNLSPALKKRMQGKACFNFKEIDETLFAELAELTETGYQRFVQGKLINP